MAQAGPRGQGAQGKDDHRAEKPKPSFRKCRALDSQRQTMKPLTAVVALVAALGVSILLHIVQYGQIRELETRVERFEKLTTKALTAHLIVLEKSLSRQDAVERLFLQSAELRLTFEQIKNYNAKTKPGNYITADRGQDAQTKKLLRAQPVQRRAQFGTKAW